jgi:hypothetical protein
MLSALGYAADLDAAPNFLLQAFTLAVENGERPLLLSLREKREATPLRRGESTAAFP